MSSTPPIASNTLRFALAEHVSLREDGWHEEAMKRAALSALLDRPSGLGRDALVSNICRVLGITVEKANVERVVDSILEQSLIVNADDSLHLSQGERSRLDQEKVVADQTVNECEARFNEVARKHGVYPAVSWASFVDELIVPMTSELGTRTMELLRGVTPVHDTIAARAYVDKFDENSRQAVRDTVTSYLDPKVAVVRTHLLGYLTNYTLVAAGGLSRKQVASLVKATGKIELDVVIDTNVAFSLLGLHRNPLNDASNALLDIRNHVDDGVKIRFHLLSVTASEAVASLQKALRDSRGVAAPAAFERAARKVGGLGGLVEGFLLARESARNLSAESYFGPYINGFESILMERGIGTIEDDGVGELRRTQERVDAWASHERGKENGKARTQLVHDVTAIEFVRTQRTAGVVGAAAARWWFVTSDFALQGRERKDLAGARNLPSSINASELIDLVRLWIPRTEAVESALVGAVKMPFAFYAYDRKLEESTLRILGEVSGIDGIQGISEEAAIRVLQDTKLRERLTSAAAGSKVETDAVVDTIKRVDIEFEERALVAEQRLVALQRSAAEPKISPKASRDTQGSKSDLLKQREKLRREITGLKAELKQKSSALSVAAQAIEDDASKLRRIRERATVLAARRMVLVQWAGFILTLVALSTVAVFYVSLDEPSGKVGSGVMIGLALLALVVQLLPKPRRPLEARWARKIEAELRLNAGLEEEPAVP